MFEKLLVPLDGSPRSEAILRPVSFLASRAGSRVTLLYVLEAPVEDHEHEADIQRSLQSRWEQAAPLARQYLAETARGLELPEETVDFEVVAGRPAEAIVDYAESHGYSLIAMATRGRGLLPGSFIGSVVHRVFHMTRLPMLVVRPQRRRGFWVAPSRFTRIVVPLDGSELAETALPYAEELARRLSLPVALVQAVPGPVEVPVGASRIVLWDLRGTQESRLDVVATGYLARVGSRLSEKGIRVDWDVSGGAAADVILSWAKRNGPALIVMATRGRSGLAHWLGSVTEAVVRQATSPVLMVPPATR